MKWNTRQGFVGKRPSLLMALEPRILYDGAGADVAAEVGAASLVPQDSGAPAAGQDAALDSAAPSDASAPAESGAAANDADDAAAGEEAAPAVSGQEETTGGSAGALAGTGQDGGNAAQESGSSGTGADTTATVSETSSADTGTESGLDTNATLTTFSADSADESTEESGTAPLDADLGEQPISQVVFVDTTVQDHQRLLDGVIEASDNDDTDVNPTGTVGTSSYTVSGSTLVVTLGENPLDDIGATLSSCRDLDAVHIISHGGEGALRLGDTVIDGSSIERYQAFFGRLGESLGEEGDLLLYGCRVGRDGQGQAFVDRLAAFSGADVNASDDDTGNASSGGDWDLEVATGPIEATPLLNEQNVGGWEGVLAAPSITGVEQLLRLGTEDTDMLVTWARIDTDKAYTGTISMVIRVKDGTLHLQSTDGLTFESGFENGSKELRFSGTRNAINKALLGHTNDSGGGTNQSMIYRPDANFSGEDKLFMSATTDATASKTFTLAIAAVNDAPNLGTAVPLTVQEGGTAGFSLAQLAVDAETLDGDIASGSQVLDQPMMVVNTLPGQGRLTYKGGLVAAGAVIPVSDLANLHYIHDGRDLSASESVFFGVTVSDGGGGSTDGTLEIIITPKNIAPAVGTDPIAILEGQTTTVLPTIALGDQFDSLATSTITIDNINTGSSDGAAQGVLFLDRNGNNQLDPGEELSGSTTLTGSDAGQIATLLKFAHNGAEPNFPGAVSPSYRITVTDAGGGEGTPLTTSQTVALAVEPNNDDPVMGGNAHATADTAHVLREHTSVTIDTTMLKVTDVDRDPTDIDQTTPAGQLVYTIESVPQHGEIRLDGAALGVGGRFTQEDIDNGRISYVQTSDIPTGPNVADKFTFIVRDSAFGYAMNDGVPGGIREGAIRDGSGAVAAQEFHFSIEPDPNATGGTAPLRPDMSNKITSQGSSVNTPSEWNEANVGAGGGYVLTREMLEYTIARISDNGTPGDSGDDTTLFLGPQEVVYTLTSLPDNGKLQSRVDGAWVEMAAGAVFTQQDINEGKVRFVSDGGEKHESSFDFTVSDGTADGTENGSFSIKVTSTNDRPEATGGEAQVKEGVGESVRLDSDALGMVDIDTDPQQDALWFQISTLPEHGKLQRWDGAAWVDVTTGQWLSRDILTATADGGTSGLRYVHDGSEPLTYAGGPLVTFSYSVRDDLTRPANAFSVDTSPVNAIMPNGSEVQAHESAVATSTIHILPVNDAPKVQDKPADPVHTINGTISGGGATESVNKVLSGVLEGGFVQIANSHLVAIDPDNTTVQRQYRITKVPDHGWLFKGQTLLGVNATFTQKDIDDGNIHYWHNGDEIGNPTTDTLGTYHDKFHFVVNDGVNEDEGADDNNNVFLIFQQSANDAPKVTVPAGPIAIDSADAANTLIAGVSVDDPDLVGGTDFLQVTVRLLHNDGTPVTDYATGFGGGGVQIGYDAASGVTVIQNGGNSILQIQGTKAQVNAALAGLSVTFEQDLNTRYKLEVISDDRLRDASGTLQSGQANGGTVNEPPGMNQPGLPVDSTNYDWSTGSRVPANNGNIRSATVDLLASRENEAPTLTIPDSITVREDISAKISGLTVVDPESTGLNLPVTVSMTIPSGQGILTVSGAAGYGVSVTGTGTQNLTLTGTADKIHALLNASGANGLYYQSPSNGNHDYNGAAAGDVTLTLTLKEGEAAIGSDTGSGSVTNPDVTRTMAITIDAVNDRPTVVLSDSSIVSIDGITPVRGFRVDDIDLTAPDGNPIAAGEKDFIQVSVRILNVGQVLDATKHGEVNFSSSSVPATGPDFAVDNTYNGRGSALVIRGTREQVNTYLAGLQVEFTGSLSNKDTLYSVDVVADDRLRDMTGVLLGSRLANGGPNENGAVSQIERNPYQSFGSDPLLPNVNWARRPLLNTSNNDAPGIGDLDTVSSTPFVEQSAGVPGSGSPLVLDGNATLTDPELSALNNWNHAVLVVQRESGNNAEDVFGLTGSGNTGINFSGNTIRNGTAVVGTFENADGKLSITFTNANQNVANAVLRAITYSNTSDNPPSSVNIEYTIHDGDADPDRPGQGQGTGGSLSGRDVIRVNITPVNDAPNLSGLSDKGYTENGDAVVIGTGIELKDPELSVRSAGAGDWGGATLTVQRAGGAQPEDVFEASGGLSALVAGSTLTDGGTAIGTVTANANGALTITFANGVTTAQAQNAIAKIAYKNTREDLAQGATTDIVLNWTLDDQNTNTGSNLGGTAGSGQDQGAGGRLSHTTTQRITLTGINDPPRAVDDSYTMNEDGGPLTLNPLTNDSDVDNDPLKITTINGVELTPGTAQSIPVSNGTVNVSADGVITFTPNPDFHGEVRFPYTISDGHGATAAAQQIITVNPVNDPPKAVDDSYTMNEDGGPLTLNPLTGDSDVDNDPLKITTINGVALTPGTAQSIPVSNGTVNVSAGGVITFTPNPDFHGEVRFPYTISDGHGGTAAAEQIITVNPVNDPPRAVDDTNEIDENTVSVTGNVVHGVGSPNSAPDSDTDGDTPLTVTGIRPGMEAAGGAMAPVAPNSNSANGATVTGRYGILMIGADGSYTYELDNGNPAVNALQDGQTLQENFTYTLSDPDGLTDTAQLTITIGGKTDGAPAISPIDHNGVANGQADVYESGLSADPPGGESKTTTGSLILNTPDGLNTVTIGGRTFTVAELTALSVGSPSAVIDTGEGELVLTGLSDVTGNPNAPTEARLNYSYTLKAAQDNSAPGSETEKIDDIALRIEDQADKSSDGTLSVRIVDDTPTANADTAGTEKRANTVHGSVAANDRIGADGPAASGLVSGVQSGDSGGAAVSGGVGTPVAGSYGHLVLRPDGSYTYTLDHNNPVLAGLAPGSVLTETFSYTIKDQDGDLSTTTLTITMTSVNDPPAAGDDSATTGRDKPVTIDVLSNDSDPDGDPLTVTGASVPPGQGTVVVNADGTITFTPAPGFTGTALISYTVSDGHGGTATATVTVNVRPPHRDHKPPAPAAPPSDSDAPAAPAPRPPFGSTGLHLLYGGGPTVQPAGVEADGTGGWRGEAPRMLGVDTALDYDSNWDLLVGTDISQYIHDTVNHTWERVERWYGTGTPGTELLRYESLGGAQDPFNGFSSPVESRMLEDLGRLLDSILEDGALGGGLSGISPVMAESRTLQNQLSRADVMGREVDRLSRIMDGGY